jgi:radical SAM superfamily enzyme YgiQ (UPF0313 family)
MSVQAESRPWKVALVGRRLADNENLGLAYLVAALAEAGIASERFVLNQASDVHVLVDAIRSGGFELVGLSIPDGGSAYLPLAFGELLRRRGFAKTITCGGSFATLARHWLLDRYPWLHSVVRFAGEVPLVRLARALRDGDDVRAIAGLTTRAGDGVPAPVLDEKPMILWPAHGDLPEVLGYPAAHIMATRGCAGRCGYCAPAALQMLEQREGLRAGISARRLRDAGVGRIRRRSIEDLCDEIAHLWRERDVRYFYFVDEHLLPYDEHEALAYLRAMKRGLRRRGVGRVGMGAMLRADRLTKPIITAFADLGLVRAFVGIELASDAEGRCFGRPFNPDHAREVLAACEAAGIVPVSHLMMVHPHATRDTIANAIRFLESAPGGVFEVTEMRVYHGTMLWRRMANEGRLIGNPLRHGYTLPDPLVASFAGIFMRLRAEAFWNHSLAYRTHDAFLAHALGRRLRPQLVDRAIAPEMAAFRDQVVALYAGSYWKALALAEAGVGAAEAGVLVDDARRKSLQLESRLQDLVHGLAHRLHTSPQVFSPTRAAAAGAIAFTFIGGVSACTHSPLVGKHDGGGDARTDGTLVADVPQPEANLADGGVACTPELAEQQRRQHQEAALQAVPCFYGNIYLYSNGSTTVESEPPGALGDYQSRACPAGYDGGVEFSARQAEWSDTVARAIAGLDRACLVPRAPPGTITFPTTIEVHGASAEQANTIWARLRQCGSPHSSEAFGITVDANGQVVGATGLPSDVEACLVAALRGLSFPCFAGSELCQSELVFIE